MSIHQRFHQMCMISIAFGGQGTWMSLMFSWIELVLPCSPTLGIFRESFEKSQLLGDEVVEVAGAQSGYGRWSEEDLGVHSKWQGYQARIYVECRQCRYQSSGFSPCGTGLIFCQLDWARLINHDQSMYQLFLLQAKVAFLPSTFIHATGRATYE